MYDIQNFGLTDMIQLGSVLRKLGGNAETMEEVANRIVRQLHDEITYGQPAEKACVLARVFKTHPYGELAPELQTCARAALGETPPTAEMRCLVLLATAGARPEWNSRQQSAGHKAIPLPTMTAVEKLPMIAQLVSQLGFDVNALLDSGSKVVLDLEHSDFNVFHVAEAAGSPHVPAQEEFVLRYGVRSVLGFGGLLPPRDLFAVILFSKASIPRETAELFKTLALSAKLALVPFWERIFQ